MALRLEDKVHRRPALADPYGGDREGVRTLELHPGDMQLFRGRYSLHRVSRVEGTKPRNEALPSWSSQPGQIGVVERTINSYGRALPVHYAGTGSSSVTATLRVITTSVPIGSLWSR